MGKAENYYNICSVFTFLGMILNKSDSGNSLKQFLAQFRVVENYLGTSNLNVEG